ncbi:MAG: methyltransferase domain-containing protein, partial [Candidatus Eisenbacteria bacterium]
MEERRPSCRAEKAFYDAYWQGKHALACDEKCRLRFILSEFGKRRASCFRIADVGCGRGWLTQTLSRFGAVTGFDLSVAEAAQRYPKLRFVQCDVLNLRPDNFDVAVCSEVIEHIRAGEQPGLIDSLSSILKDGGTLILTTPNRSQVSRLVSELGLESELQPVEDWLDIEGLEKLLAPRFEIERLSTVMFFPLRVRRVGPLSRLYRFFYEELGFYRVVDPLLTRSTHGMYITVVARKR